MASVHQQINYKENKGVEGGTEGKREQMFGKAVWMDLS